MTDHLHVRFTHHERAYYRVWRHRTWRERLFSWPWTPWRAYGLVKKPRRPKA